MKNEDNGHYDAGMRCHLVSRLVSEGFRRLGRLVGRHPLLSILVPLAASLALAPGLLLFQLEEDPELLYVPATGRCLRERAEVEASFPQDWHNFDPGRATRPGAFGQLLVVRRDGRSLLTADTFAALARLHLAVKSVTIPEHNLTFSDLCVSTAHACVEPDVLRRLGPRMEAYEEGLTRIRYPLDPDTAGFYGGSLGGVTLDHDGFLRGAKAILLVYHIIPQPANLARAWEEAFLAMEVTESTLDVARYTSHSQEEEMRVNSLSLFPHFSYIVILMVLFAVGTSVTGDWVRSKPWMGAAGCLTSSLGTASAFGLCLYLGQRMSTTCLGVPFLILGEWATLI
ncbi:daf-6 [Cordylochernes scorpioides]|uniref:Daf-6 n=1 Tax=Cordylochernes scorpioides TaxID=51811 RepID=A0ABY6KNT9_9ARAC|nr:daf-6 [Cordylochernes scorpioides]